MTEFKMEDIDIWGDEENGNGIFIGTASEDEAHLLQRYLADNQMLVKAIKEYVKEWDADCEEEGNNRLNDMMNLIKNMERGGTTIEY